MHTIDWCEGDLQLVDIGTKSLSEPDLSPRMKYIMVILKNWDRTLVQDGLENTKNILLNKSSTWLD